MQHENSFIRAYHEFRRSVDFTKSGLLPEIYHLIWCMVMGIPDVPADQESSSDAEMKAIDQRVAILKAVFVELNREETDEFLDEGLLRYDHAGNVARRLLSEVGPVPEPDSLCG
jgi:hypothetical protein